MRKLVIYVSIFCLIIASFPCIVNASAYNSDIINLLPANSYQVRFGNGSYVDSDVPGGLSNASSAHIKWSNSVTSTNVDHIYINVRSSKPVTTLRLSDVNSSTPPAADYVGMYDGLYQFRIALENFNFTVFYVRIHFGSETNVEFLIESVYGTSNDSSPVVSADIHYFRRYIDRGYEVSTIQQVKDGESLNAYLPVSKVIWHECYPITSMEWSYECVHINIDANSLNFRALDNITYLFKASNISEAYISVFSGSNSSATVYPVEVNSYPTATKIYSLPDEEGHLPIVYYELNADLSGADISGKTISLVLYIEPWRTDSSPYYFIYLDFYSCFYSPENINVPWYQVMWTWIKGGFTSVTDTLNSLLGDSSDGALGEAAGEMSQQAEEMDQANESLNNIARPDVDPDALFGNTLNFSPGGMMVLSSLTNNSVITPILLVVCAFALVGFIFFGKKG